MESGLVQKESGTDHKGDSVEREAADCGWRDTLLHAVSVVRGLAVGETGRGGGARQYGIFKRRGFREVSDSWRVYGNYDRAFEGGGSCDGGSMAPEGQTKDPTVSRDISDNWEESVGALRRAEEAKASWGR
jgi:hypothetical protein